MLLACLVAMLLCCQEHTLTNAVSEVERGIGTRTVSNCTLLPTNVRQAYVGFPHRVTCEKGYATYSYDYDTSGQCLIWDLDQKKLLLNSSADNIDSLLEKEHLVDDVSVNGSLNFLIEITLSNNSSCTGQPIRLNVTEHTPQTCHHAVANGQTVQHHQADLGKHKQLNCFEDDSGIDLDHSRHNFSVTWLRNCSELGNLSIQIEPSAKDPSLRLPPLTFDHPGIYTCMIKYNGLTLHTLHYKMCVLGKHSMKQPSVKCLKNTYYVTLGESVTLTCFVGGPNNLKRITHGFKWDKVSLHNKSNVQAACQLNNEPFRKGQKLNCSLERSKKKCFLHIPNQEERRSLSTQYIMRLTINNVQAKDLGAYVAIIRTALKGNPTISATIYVRSDSLQVLRLQNTLVIVGLMTLALILCLLFILWWKRIYLQVFYQRKFGTYEIDDKKYGAFLSYHFSTDMDKFAQKQTHDACLSSREVLENLGYRVYDEHRDGNSSGMRIENALNTMRQCHRVVIILSKDYLKDQWSLFSLQKSFQTMIESKSRIIFVLVPGIREYIKQHGREEDTQRMIKRATLLNYVISWSDNKNFNKRLFKLRFEHAMPKLRAKMHTRHESTTSSLLWQHYTNGVQRTTSMETETTESGSPRTVDGTASVFVIEPGPSYARV